MVATAPGKYWPGNDNYIFLAEASIKGNGFIHSSQVRELWKERKAVGGVKSFGRLSHGSFEAFPGRKRKQQRLVPNKTLSGDTSHLNTVVKFILRLTKRKQSKNCESCPTQVSWKVKSNVNFVCPVCPVFPACPVLSFLSVLSVLSVPSVLSVVFVLSVMSVLSFLPVLSIL